MPQQCRYLLMPVTELEKVKLQFREEVRTDAEKCIKEECPAFSNGECLKQCGSIHLLNIGGTKIGSYYPPENYLNTVQ